MSGHSVRKRIVISDCDGDDPTCEQFYGINDNKPFFKIVQQGTNSQNPTLETSHTLVFNILGQLVHETSAGTRCDCDDLGETGIFFKVFLDTEGKKLGSTKIHCPSNY